MSHHHPELILCRRSCGVNAGKLCERCDGRCPLCDSYVSPTAVVFICDECFSSPQTKDRCIICNNSTISSLQRTSSEPIYAYYCRGCTLQEKDRDGCPRIQNIANIKLESLYERKK